MTLESPADSPKQVNLLELAPVRLAEWEEDGSHVVIHARRHQPTGLRRWLRRIGIPSHPKRIRLDELGSFAWTRLDGETTVGEIARALREHFPDVGQDAEERLGKFVGTLRREGFLAYPGFDRGR